MLQISPHLRPSMADLIGHEWMRDVNEDTEEQARYEMQQRYMGNIEQQQQENQQAHIDPIARRPTNMRSEVDEEETRNMK